ncbi:hypothetical protein BGY98DRAFT_1012314, partial [Russula aff. rugulosa BPL654]
MIFFAMVRSRVSPSLMACSHLPLIYWSVGVSFPLTLLQLRTQTKWVVSETSVERCRRQVGLGAGSSIGVLDSELVGCLEGGVLGLRSVSCLIACTTRIYVQLDGCQWVC